jgi:hypothetical protein
MDIWILIDVRPLQVKPIVDNNVSRAEVTIDKYMRRIVEIRVPIFVYQSELSSATLSASPPIFVAFSSLYLAVYSRYNIIFRKTTYI